MLRASRDKPLAGIIEKTNEFWHSTLRGLLRAARDEGDLPKTIDPDGMAAVIVATLKGVYLLPGKTSGAENIDKALRQLEDLLGLRGRTSKSH